MQKYFSKNLPGKIAQRANFAKGKIILPGEKKFQKEQRTFKTPQDKSVKRFQQNATRLEHINVRNKNKSKKGN